jgi:hypothetical protein
MDVRLITGAYHKNRHQFRDTLKGLLGTGHQQDISQRKLLDISVGGSVCPQERQYQLESVPSLVTRSLGQICQVIVVFANLGKKGIASGQKMCSKF